MNKNPLPSYKNDSDIYRGNEGKDQPQLKNLYSPFRKNLPIIFQIDSSPHKSFNANGADYLQQNYQSRLIEQQSWLWSIRQQSLPNESQVLSVRQRQLVNKIYQKQKQLVILQDKIFQLKNSNQCLRETIQEINVQKRQLQTQLQDSHKNIEQLQRQKGEIYQKLNELKQQKNQQSNFFGPQLNTIQQTKMLQLLDENYHLRQQIQALKSFYQEEIYRMLNRNEQNFKYLEQKNKQKQQNNAKLNQKIFQLETQLFQIKNQKKQMLEYYLQVIEQMNIEIGSLRSWHQQNKQKSQILPSNIYQDLLNGAKQNNSFNQFNQSMQKTFDLQQMLKNNVWNQWLIGLVKKSLTKQIQGDLKIKETSGRKQIKKSQSISSLNNLTSNLQNSNYMNLSFTQKYNTGISKDNSLVKRIDNSRQSKKQFISPPPSSNYIKPIPYSKYNNNTLIFSSNYKNRMSKKIIQKRSQDLLMSHKLQIEKSSMKSQKQKYLIIDKKLEQLKDKLTKQLLK